MPKFRASIVVPVELLVEAENIDEAFKKASMYAAEDIPVALGGQKYRPTSTCLSSPHSKVVSILKGEQYVNAGMWPYVQIVEELKDEKGAA